MIVPNYTDAGIVNLMGAILSASDAPSDYAPLQWPALKNLRDVRNSVLIVIDGLGYDYLCRNAGGGALHDHLAGRLTSVFPSTTASAVTTFLTGVAPQQHALTGWFTYFEELGEVIAPLPLRRRAGKETLRAPGIDVRGLFHTPSIFEKLDCQSFIVLPAELVESDFSVAHAGPAIRRGYKTLEGFFGAILASIRGSTQRKFVYAYWPRLDEIAHDAGIESHQAVAHLNELDAAFGAFLPSIEAAGTTVMVTADHGFIDTVPESRLHLEDYPGLAETLALPLCGEARAPFCYVKPGREDRFENYFSAHLSRYAELHRSEDLVGGGFFGLGRPDPRLAGRIGTYALLMKENFVLEDLLPGEKPKNHIGVHGGLSEREMYVPLTVVAA